MTDIIIRYVDGYGYLPIIEINGVEFYRGEFQKSAVEALEKCAARLSAETD